MRIFSRTHEKHCRTNEESMRRICGYVWNEQNLYWTRLL